MTVTTPRLITHTAALLALIAGAPACAPLRITPEARTDQSRRGPIPQREVMEKGLSLLGEGRLEEAAANFRYALKYNPQNAAAHVALATTYDVQARAGDRDKRDLAEVGYRQALEFDPRSWIAAYRLGLLDIESRRYDEAIRHLTSAAVVRRDDPEVLNALAAALYYGGEVKAARAIIEKALAVSTPEPRLFRNAALIAAAGGDFERAGSWRGQLTPADASVAFVDRRMSDWRFELSHLPAPVAAGQTLAAGAPQHADTTKTGLAPATRSPFLTPGTSEALTTLMSPLAAPAAGAKARMIQVDVVLIRTQEIEADLRGVNLLRSLQLQFQGSDSRTITSNRPNGTSADANDVTRIVTRQISFPGVAYSLNIANNGYDRSDVLARPTLVALDGQPANFFVGEELSIAVSGQFQGSLVDKKVGIELAVTPTFLDDDTALLSVSASRSFLNTHFLPAASSTLRTTQARVTTSIAVDFDKTVVLSGLSEHENEISRLGVPILQEIPGIQYLFSEKDLLKYEKSVLILLTPHRVGSAEPSGTTEPGRYQTRGMDQFQRYFPDLAPRLNTLEQVAHELKGSAFRDMLALDDMDTKEVFARKDFFSRLAAQLMSVISF